MSEVFLGRKTCTSFRKRFLGDLIAAYVALVSATVYYVVKLAVGLNISISLPEVLVLCIWAVASTEYMLTKFGWYAN